MDKVFLIFGPQLTGMILLLAGVIFKAFPPKFTNKWYKYNIPSVNKNQETWNEGNRYIPKRLMWSGVILIVAGVLISWLLSFIHLSTNAKAALYFMLTWGASIAAVISLIVTTEKRLAHLSNKS